MDCSQGEGELWCSLGSVLANPAVKYIWPVVVTQNNTEFPGLYILTWINNWVWATLGRTGLWARYILKELTAGGSVLLEEGSVWCKSLSSTD